MQTHYFVRIQCVLLMWHCDMSAQFHYLTYYNYCFTDPVQDFNLLFFLDFSCPTSVYLLTLSCNHLGLWIFLNSYLSLCLILSIFATIYISKNQIFTSLTLISLCSSTINCRYFSSILSQDILRVVLFLAPLGVMIFQTSWSHKPHDLLDILISQTYWSSKPDILWYIKPHDQT